MLCHDGGTLDRSAMQCPVRLLGFAVVEGTCLLDSQFIWLRNDSPMLMCPPEAKLQVVKPWERT